MVTPAKIATQANRHEEIFLEKYVRLCDWALQLTQNDRERAEDLVHDLYVQLVHARPDLEKISNLNGYLYRTLHNLNISQLRRHANQPTQQLSVVDYDSAESSLRAADPRELIKYQDDLRHVCHYASIRKESSKAGSALILRFLHGYYPREIALVMKCTREAVEERLRLARNEARQFLQNPTQLRFLQRPAEVIPPAPPTGFVRPVDQLLAELREQVFSSRRGACPPSRELKELYGPSGTQKLDSALLGHLVSCAQCLDEINGILDLPPLADRFPTDTIGIDSPPRDNDRTSGGDGDGGGVSEEGLQKYRRRAQEVVEQRPQSLRISINGNIAAEQLVSSDSCTQILNLHDVEEIEFIEILSEQQTLLLMISLDDETQEKILNAGIELGDGRKLEVVVNLDETRPRVEVNFSQAAQEQPVESAAPRLVAATLSDSILRRFLRRVGEGLQVALNPTAITASVAVVLIAVLLFVRFNVPAVTARELLTRAADVERTLAGQTGTVMHRTIALEVDSAVRQRLEIWHSAKLGITSRRIYDDTGKLIAGEWSRGNGASTIYRPGSPSQSRIASEVAGTAILEAGEFWRLDPSVNNFKALVGNSDAITVKDEASSYLLSFNGGNGALLAHASLRIDKRTTRSMEQTLTLNQQGTPRVVRFVETGFDQKAFDTVSPAVFEVDTEFGAAGVNLKSPESSNSKDKESPEVVASPELEIEVTYLLNQIKANLGEQINLSRTPAGSLHVEAVTESEQRKEEILRALAPVRDNPAVRIDVSTVAEAARKLQGKTRPGDIIDREVEAADNRSPSDNELQQYFMSRVEPTAVENEIRKFTREVMGHSRQALLRASALQKLVKRFSPAEVEALAPDAREKWIAMVQEQANGCQRSIIAARNALRRVYPNAGSTSGENVGAASLQAGADRLVQLSYKNDDAIRRAFTVAEEGNSSASLFGSELWQSLADAEQLAREIQRLAGSK